MRDGHWRHRLRYFVSDAWDEWKHSPGVNLLAVSTLVSVLFLAAVVMLVLANVEQRVSSLRGDIRVEIYFHDDASGDSRRALLGQLEARDGVARVVYVDQQEALRRYREWAGAHAELIDELETNPLPSSLEVFLESGPEAERRATEIVDSLRGHAGLEDVRFDADWLRRLEELLGFARWGSLGLGTIVFAAVVFVMASVLRLAVYARRDEIEIMLLVGATPAFVRGPFLVAGLAQGLTASILALVLVEAVRQLVLVKMGTDSVALLNWVASRPLPTSLTLVVVGVGLLVSFAGSSFAVRRSL